MTRILLWPTYSFPGNIGADSLYIIGRNLIRATPVGAVHWVVIVPELATVPVDDLDERPDVVKVRHKMPPNYRLQESAPTQEILTKYAGVEGTEPVDAVITMSPARAMNLANTWAQKATETCRQVIVTWDLLVRDDKPGEFVAVRPELIHQAVGSLASDVVVHESPVARKMTLDVARRFLSPSAANTIGMRPATAIRTSSPHRPSSLRPVTRTKVCPMRRPMTSHSRKRSGSRAYVPSKSTAKSISGSPCRRPWPSS